MKTIKHFYTKFENFFFNPQGDHEFLVFFRMSIGSVILLHFLAVIKDFNLLYSSEGLIPLDIMEVHTSMYSITLTEIVQAMAQLGLSEATSLLIFKVVFIVLCCCIIAGFFGRIAALLLLFLQIALMKTGSFYAYGVDFFTSMSLVYLVLFPSDHYRSLRARFFNFKKQNFMPVKRMFQIHLSMAYCFSGFDKLLGFNWRNGESIWKAVHLPYVNSDFNFNLDFLAEYPAIPIVIGWATVIIELCYPVFIWIPQTRRTWLLLTVSMHVGIALVLNLYYFSAVMIVWNLTNFYFEKRQAIPDTVLGPAA